MAVAAQSSSSGETPNTGFSKTGWVFRLIILSFLIFISTFIVCDLIEECLLNGVVAGVGNSLVKAVFYVVIFGLVWLMFVLPINLLTLLLCRWLRWSKYRSQLVLGPSLCFFGTIILLQIINLPTTRRVFETEAGVPLPHSAHDVRCFAVHNVKGDINDTYFFECNPADVANLIQAMHLTEDKTGYSGYPLAPPQQDWPDARTWLGRRAYSFTDPDKFLFYTLVANENQNQVYLYIIAG